MAAFFYSRDEEIKKFLRATGNIFAGLRRRGEITIMSGTTYFLLQERRMTCRNSVGGGPSLGAE